MRKSRRTEADTLPWLEVALYLFLIPATFAACLHYFENQNKSTEVTVAGKVKGDLTPLKYLLANFAEVRKSLLFYFPENQYREVTKTNEAFNYSFPLLGQRELHIIKGKEDNLFRSATHQQYVVG